MSRSNLAYDFSRFDDRKQNARTTTKQTAEIKVAPKSEPKAHPVRVFALIAAIVVVASAMIYSQVVLTELGDKVNAVTNDINIVKSENVRKATELDSKMSLKSVEEYAENNLGLVKLDQSRIEYVSLSEDNKIEITKEKDDSFVDSVKKLFASVKEYFE